MGSKLRFSSFKGPVVSLTIASVPDGHRMSHTDKLQQEQPPQMRIHDGGFLILLSWLLTQQLGCNSSGWLRWLTWVSWRRLYGPNSLGCPTESTAWGSTGFREAAPNLGLETLNCQSLELGAVGAWLMPHAFLGTDLWVKTLQDLKLLEVWQSTCQSCSDYVDGQLVPSHCRQMVIVCGACQFHS